MQKIALALIDGKECKELYKIKAQEVNTLDNLLSVCHLDRVKTEAQRDQYKLMADGYAREATSLRKELTEEKKKNRWLRIGLGATVGLLVGVLTYLSVK